MPSIVIKEIDETTGGGRVGSTDIVYVPGFRASASVTDAWPKNADGSVDISNAAPIKEPILCETVAEFKKYFGNQPIDANDLYYGRLGLGSDANESEIQEAIYGQTPITKDLSYIYAIELLNNGIPVLYEAVDAVSNITDDILKDFYVYLADAVEGPFGKLRERGEFDVKYLTTGGYYNFGIDFGNLVKFSVVNPNPKYMVVETESNISEFYDPLLSEGCKEGTFIIDGNGDDGTEWIFINNTPGNTFTLDTQTATSYVDTYFSFSGYDGNDMGTSFDFVIDEISGNNLIDVMADCARARGDAIAFVDPLNDRYQPLVGQGSYYNQITTKVANWGDTSTYTTTFIPSVNIDTTQLPSNDTYLLPGSYAYLAALGQSMKNNPSWLAIAGAARGGIPKLNGANPFDLQKRLSNTIAENEYQNRDGISINAITNIKPFGQRIWGNRTLKNNALEGNLTATSFLNIRNLVCDVKKIVYQACRKYTFEQNNDILWTNFKAYIEPTLERMRTGAGISGYKIIKGTTTEKAKLVATVKLYPIYAVEDFEITVVMSDDEVSVS